MQKAFLDHLLANRPFVHNMAKFQLCDWKANGQKGSLRKAFYYEAGEEFEKWSAMKMTTPCKNTKLKRTTQMNDNTIRAMARMAKARGPPSMKPTVMKARAKKTEAKKAKAMRSA